MLANAEEYMVNEHLLFFRSLFIPIYSFQSYFQAANDENYANNEDFIKKRKLTSTAFGTLLK